MYYPQTTAAPSSKHGLFTHVKLTTVRSNIARRCGISTVQVPTCYQVALKSATAAVLQCNTNATPAQYKMHHHRDDSLNHRHPATHKHSAAILPLGCSHSTSKSKCTVLQGCWHSESSLPPIPAPHYAAKSTSLQSMCMWRPWPVCCRPAAGLTRPAPARPTVAAGLLGLF